MDDKHQLERDCELAARWADGIIAMGAAHDGLPIAQAVRRLVDRAQQKPEESTTT